jgi:hypothetical protein
MIFVDLEWAEDLRMGEGRCEVSKLACIEGCIATIPITLATVLSSLFYCIYSTSPRRAQLEAGPFLLRALSLVNLAQVKVDKDKQDRPHDNFQTSTSVVRV